MRTLVLILLVAAAARAAEPPAAGGAAAIAVVKKDGKPALHAILPAGWTAVDGHDGKTVFRSPTGAPHVELFPIDVDVAAAAKDPGKLIADEVTDFTVIATDSVVVGEAPAKRVTGTGKEADDGDPSNAQVVFFTAAGSTWALCAHGEGDGVAKAGPTLKALMDGIAPAQ